MNREERMLEIDLREILSWMTMIVRVRRIREMKARLWIGLKLIKLSAWIIGIKHEEERD